MVTIAKMEFASFRPINTFIKTATLDGNQTLRVAKDPAVTEVDEPTFAKLVDSDFKNGIIEVRVLSKLLANAPDYARGFIGIAFRIDENNSKFEGIYIRPTNGRADDQLRRNRSTQYFSHPDFKFDRLRNESSGMYESYADMGLNEWIKIKIEIKDEKAKLYLNESSQPVLVVNDLKHGADSSGGIGLWIDIGTDGYFADLRIKKERALRKASAPTHYFSLITFYFFPPYPCLLINRSILCNASSILLYSVA